MVNAHTHTSNLDDCDPAKLVRVCTLGATASTSCFRVRDTAPAMMLRAKT